jgi:transcriptional regulator with XRE-family HTH domain
MAKKKKQKMGNLTLAQKLKILRKASGLTLRNVETCTAGEISNAYLSQLENGKNTRPSPDKLRVLGLVFEVSYESLMELAGYLPSPNKTTKRKSS